MPSAAAPRPLVALRGAGRRVDGRWLWRDLDVAVRPGERLAVAGPSGSGKTLLLRALAGLDALDAGALTADGAPVASLPAHRARVAYVAQRPALDGTVHQALAAPFAFGAHADRAFDRTAAGELLRALGRAPELVDADTATLSGGEAQTVGLARALLTAPSVLLLDEPTAGLDPDRTAAAEAAVDAFLAAGGRAAVWTSHDAAQLARLTDRRLAL